MNTVKKSRLVTGAIFAVMVAITVAIINKGAGKNYNVLIGWIALGTLVWCTWSMKRYTGTFFSLIYMFEVALYILTMGQSLLYAIGIPLLSGQDLYLNNSAKEVNTAYLYSILCMIALHYGILCNGMNNKLRFTFGKRYIRRSPQQDERDYTAIMRQLAWLAFPFALVSYGFTMAQLFRAYGFSGYADAYASIGGNTSWGKLLSMIGEFFPTVLFLLLASYRNDKRMSRVVISMILVITLMNFALGNRSEPICYLMAVLWFCRRYANTAMQKRRSTLLMVAVSILIMLIIPIIGATRNTGELSISTVINSFSGEGAVAHALKDTIIGMGWSAFPLVKTMQIIPTRVEFHYGQSYFFALLSIFPNIFGGTHISVQYAGLPQWLMDYLNLSFGPGYSLPAEAYYNFGWLGIAVMPLIGWLVAKLLDERKESESALRLFVIMAAFIILFSFPRREMLTAIRNITYRVGCICLAIKLLGGSTAGKKVLKVDEESNDAE